MRLYICALLGALTACGGGGAAPYDDLPACVADHMADGLPEAHSIVHCLVDYPDLHDPFGSIADCVAFVTANGGYPDSRDAACADYFVQTGAVDAGP